MYKCAECGNVFEEDDLYRWEERHGLDSPPYEQWAGCPSCHSTSYEEAHSCNGCGEYFAGDDDYIDGWCHECAKDVYTDALGVEFLYHPFNKGTPNEFTVGEDFVKYYFSDDDLRSSLAQDMLLSSLLISIHMDCALNRNGAERKALKAFCLEECDIELWIDYLKASGACDV